MIQIRIFADLLGENAHGPGAALGFQFYGMGTIVTVLASKTSREYMSLVRPKKNMCVYCHMLKKIRVGRSEMIFFLILFFISELMLDGI